MRTATSAGTRWWNVKHPAAYVARLRAGQSPAVGREVLDEATRAVEEVLLGVRMAERAAGGRPRRGQRAQVDVLVADGLGTVTGGRFRLTRPVDCSPMPWCAGWSLIDREPGPAPGTPGLWLPRVRC